MLPQKQKYIGDKLSREILIYCVENSRHKDFVELKNYILNEASYEEVIIAAMTGKVLVTEDEASKQAKMVKAEATLKQYLRMPLSILASGPIRKGVSSAVKQKLGRTATGAVAGAAGFAGGMVGGVAASMAITWGVTVLAKVIFHIVRKNIDVCLKGCEKKFDIRDAFYKYKVPICTSECRIDIFKKTMANIQSERGQCNATPNPDKCEHNLLGQLIKYKQLLAKEIIRLEKRKLSAKKAEMKRNKRVSHTAEPPKMKNVLAT